MYCLSWAKYFASLVCIAHVINEYEIDYEYDQENDFGIWSFSVVSPRVIVRDIIGVIAK